MVMTLEAQSIPMHIDVDGVRIQDTPLSGADDPAILEWAYQQQRILLTHDVSTMTHYAYQRIAAG